ncbi:MAG: hypothetical protein KIT43_10305 [Bauldia sp.]|nr:hypothetical protein [Bauldia sp.]
MTDPIYDPYFGIPQFKTFGRPMGDIPDSYAPWARIFTDDQDAWAYYMLQQLPGASVWRDWSGAAHIGVPQPDGTFEVHSFNAQRLSWNDLRTGMNNLLRLWAIPAAAEEAAQMLPIPGLGDPAALSAAAWVQSQQNRIADEVGDWHIPEPEGRAPVYIDDPSIRDFRREAYRSGVDTGRYYGTSYFNNTLMAMINELDQGNIWDLLRFSDNLESWHLSAITKGEPGEAEYWAAMRDEWQETLGMMDPNNISDPYGQYGPTDIRNIYRNLVYGVPYGGTPPLYKKP